MCFVVLLSYSLYRYLGIPLPARYEQLETVSHPLSIKLTWRRDNQETETLEVKERFVGLLMDTITLPEVEYSIALSVNIPLNRATLQWYYPDLEPISLVPSRERLLTNYITDAALSPALFFLLDALLGQTCLLDDLSWAETLTLLELIDAQLGDSAPIISAASTFALIINHPEGIVQPRPAPAPEVIITLNNLIGIESHIVRALIQSHIYAPMLRSLVSPNWTELHPSLLLAILKAPRGLEPVTLRSLNLELAIGTINHPRHLMALQYFQAALSNQENLPDPAKTIRVIWDHLVERLWKVEERPHFDLFFLALARAYPTYMSYIYYAKNLGSDPFIGHLARYGSLLGTIILELSNVHCDLENLVAEPDWSDGRAMLTVVNYILGLIKWNDRQHQDIEPSLMAVGNFAIFALKGFIISDKLMLFAYNQLSTLFSLWMRLESFTLRTLKGKALAGYAKKVRRVKDFRIFTYILHYLGLGLKQSPQLLSNESDAPWLLGIQKVYEEPHQFLKSPPTSTKILLELPQDWLRNMRWIHLKNVVRALLYFTLGLPFEESDLSDDRLDFLGSSRQARLIILVTEAYNRWIKDRAPNEAPRVFSIKFSQ